MCTDYNAICINLQRKGTTIWFWDWEVGEGGEILRGQGILFSKSWELEIYFQPHQDKIHVSNICAEVRKFIF